MEQSSGRSRLSWEFRGSGGVCVRGHHQTRKTPFKQEKRLSNKKNTFQARRRLSIKGYLPIKCRSLQVVGVSGQGKAVVSDAEETKGNGRRRWRGVGPAGRPSLFPFGVSVILKI